MKGLETEALRDPKSVAYTLVATPVANAYSYAVFATDGVTACDNVTTDCGAYTLTATNEGGGIYSKTNLN